MQPIILVSVIVIVLLALLVRAAFTHGHRTSNMPVGEFSPLSICLILDSLTRQQALRLYHL